MKTINWNVIYAYSIEFLIAAALCAGAWWAFGFAAVATFVEATASEWATLMGTLFAASLAVWLTFVNIRATEFGDHLETLGSVGVYSAAFITAMIAHFSATVALIAAKGAGVSFVTQVAFVLMIYGGINLLTLIRNASGLVTLYGVFRRMPR